ncbi:DUF47 family protein [Limnoraphis robusta Tam1]|uniref:DUF47 family protein n=1 Tax=Limnoraphis robusta CCNP1315 TaxID=3110306 RepID=A0ABU5U3L3_9CYAN|nr:DUF47 family protein [Limnoraphis robusta]MEA5500077.1 DUF47 family protein [Limnoraphis robusta BA-68 BA1]MEA5521223.1 DUF47 family protein [Limnoraphis robusta CCNP1315]MEA5539871.1 DUF47 family protein [Limnoraphis robusta Tam1]MEA5548977.1 DUF47 family protein [Limnoraphis robusta CCNP1324]
MSEKIPSFFGKTKFIESQLDEFMDKVSEGSLYFEMGLTSYLAKGFVTESCEEKMQQIQNVKDRCNELRRAIESELYTEMLIPDSRGDVLSLLENLYYLIDVFGDIYQDIIIEKLEVPTVYEKDFKDLTQMVVKSVETIVIAARSFFRDPRTVRDHIYKVRVYESESDKIALRLKKNIFDSQLPLERKIQLRDSVNVINSLADAAENASDKLAIYAIKRVL